MSHFDLIKVTLEEVEPADIAVMLAIASKAASVDKNLYRDLSSELKISVVTVASMQHRFSEKWRRVQHKRKVMKAYTLPRNVVLALHHLALNTNLVERDFNNQILKLIDKKI